MIEDFKKFWIAFAVMTLFVIGVAGCDQWAARSGYGTMQSKLQCDQKLVNATWKGTNAELWTITRPMRPSELPETHRFKASTLFGVLEGEVIFIESKC